LDVESNETKEAHEDLRSVELEEKDQRKQRIKYRMAKFGEVR